MQPAEFDPTCHGWGCADREAILIGPPGTGKTRAVLDAFLVPAVDAGAAVLGCSFTRAAAGEMRERLRAATGCSEQTGRATCRTIHSEAFRLCRQDAPQMLVWQDGAAGPGKRRRGAPSSAPAEQEQGDLSDAPDGGLVDLAEAMFSSPLDDLAPGQRDLAGEARRLWGKARHVYPDDLGAGVASLMRRVYSAESRPRYPLPELAAAAEHYERLKTELGMADFTDMLTRALDLPAPRRDLLVVDEAQDSSPLMIRLVEHWGRAADHLVWVGDPDQAIYGFAGADGEHLHTRMREGMPARRLAQSWRVPRQVHTMARDLIRLTFARVDAPYLPADREGEVFVEAHPQRAIVAALAGAPGSALVLARSARGLGPYMQTLAEAGIPYRNERGGSPWQQGALRELVLALAALTSGRPLTGREARRIIKALPGRPRGAWFRGTKKAAEEWAKGAAEREVALLTAEAIESASGAYLTRLRADGTPDAALDRIGKADLAQGLLLVLRRGGERALREEPAVTLTTIHGAKGREADSVLLDLAAPYPCRAEVAERGAVAERRVVYVGLTRTRQRLTVRMPSNRGACLGRLTGLY